MRNSIPDVVTLSEHLDQEQGSSEIITLRIHRLRRTCGSRSAIVG
jgi:hypothetical protein